MSNKAKLDAAIAAAEAKYGDLPPGVLAKIAKVESNYGENLVNPKSSARGPFQFMENTGPEFGLKDENDRLDFDKSADAAARLTVRNKKVLEEKLGRPVTAGELYLAHQQGANGALKLLANPNKLAAEVRSAQAVKLNGGDPDNMTAGEFANKWISKVDGSGGPAPQKKANAAPGGIGTLPRVPSAKDFYQYDPRALSRLAADTKTLKRNADAMSAPPPAPAPPAAPIARMSIGQLAGAEPTVTAPGEKPAPVLPRRDTAILHGLSVFQKTAERVAPLVAGAVPTEEEVTGVSGLGGAFTQGFKSGAMGMSADNEYFGAIVETLLGNETGAAARIANARQMEAGSSKELDGMQSFEQFLNAPTFDGFLTQATSAMGQVAPSAVESIATALVGGGLFSLAKAGMSTGSKTVAKVLVKDMINKKAKGAVLDKTEEGVLNGLYGNFKRNFSKGAVAGAFGSEYKAMAGSAFAEFGEGGADMDLGAALQSLAIAAPQAAIGVWGEKAIVDGLAGLALKKSTRKAGDSVLKRFAADVAGLSLKSGFTEGGTEFLQESISVAQRFAIDPTYTAEDAKLRLAQATFAGFFGGGGFGGAAAAPAAGIAAINRATVGDKVVKKAKDMLGKVRDTRIETEIDEVTRNVNDASLSGATAPESPQDIMAQIDAVIKGDSPKKAVWASEQQSSAFGDIVPGEIKIIKLTDRDDSVVYVANIPGQGNLITPDKNIAEEFIATYHVEGDMDEARRIALGYTSGKTGDNVVRVKDDKDAVVSEQMTDDGGIVDAATAAEEIASTVPGAQVDVTDTDTALEERAQKVAFEKGEMNELAQFMNGVVDSLNESEPTEADFAIDKRTPGVRRMEITMPEEEFQNWASSGKEEDLKSVPAAARPMLQSILKWSEELEYYGGKVHGYNRSERVWDEISNDDPETYEVETDGFGVPWANVSDLSMEDMNEILVSYEDSLEDEKTRKSSDQEVVDNITLNIRKLKRAIENRAANTPNASPEEDTEEHIAAREKQLGLRSYKSPDYELGNTNMVKDEEDGHLAADLTQLEKMYSDGDFDGASPDELFAIRNDIRAAKAELERRGLTLDEKGNIKEERVLAKGPNAKQITPYKDKPAVKTKKMDMKSEPAAESVSDEEQASQDEIDAIDAQLQEAFASGDMEVATVVETMEPNTKDRAGFEQAFAMLVNSVPAGLRDVIDNYRQFKDKLDTAIIDRVEELRSEIPETVFMFRETEDGAIEIVRNDTATDRDTYLEREAVAAAIKMVYGMAKVASGTGIWFRNAAGKVYRGTFKRRNPKTRAMETLQGSFSNFYLHNTNKGAGRKLLNLGGTSKTKKNPMGRSGLMALAEAGKRLNAQTDRAFQGDGMTQLQQLRSGLETMLSALARAGYEIMYSPAPSATDASTANAPALRFDPLSGGYVQVDGVTQNNTSLKPVVSYADTSVTENVVPIVRGFQQLQGEAVNEVFAFINDKPITVVDLFNVAHPFEASSNGQFSQGKPNEFNVEIGPNGKERMKGPDTLGPDPNDPREEVSQATERNTVLSTSRQETGRSREQVRSTRAGATFNMRPASNDATKSMVSKQGVVDSDNPMNVSIEDDGTRTVTRVEQSDAKRVAQAGFINTVADESEQFANAEDKKKRRNKEERDDSKEEESLRRAQIAVAVAEAKATAKEEGTSIPVAVAEVLPAMPDDVTITYTQVGSGWMATVTSPRFERKTITAKSKNMVIVRAHELAVKQSENTAIRYNRLTIETTEATMAEREKFPEISGAGSPEIKDQTSEKKTRKMSPAANSVRFFGNVGKLTGRVASIASARFRFGAPVDVMTLKYLADNFDALTGPGKPYERARDHIADAIEQMNERGKDEPGRVILGPNRHVIILRDEPLNRVSMSDKDDIFYQDDAEIGAVLAHEIGHIVFQQEYDKQINLGPEQSAVWKLYQQQLVEVAAEGTNKDPNPDADDLNWEAFKRAMKIMKEENGEVSPELPRNFKDFKEWRIKYRAVRKTNATLRKAYDLAKVQIKEETGVVPESYTNDKNGFEEWYADQVMAFVQNEARQAKNVAEGTIKKLAAAFQQFFNKVNDALNGRLKLFTVKKYNPGTKKNEVVWSFADYMNEVTARHKNNAVLNNEFGVVQQMTVKSMTLNLRSRIPAGAVTAMQNQARRIMSTGKWGNVARGALNLVHASTDFMALPAHGDGGKNLSTFFGTLSQSLDAAGWNKREIFQQNRMHNELGDIVGINEKDSPKAWDSPATRAIMMEAFDEDIPTAQLVSQEAKNIRAFYENIADTYMERPGGQGRLKYWIKEFQKRANYGGPRMWNVAKIAEDEQGFITWLEPRLRQTSGTSDAAQRAKDIFDALTQHTQDQVALIARQVDHDVRLLTNVTPANIAMRKFEKSMTERAVMEQRDKTLRELRRGVIPVDDFINELVAFNASDPDAQALRALPADQKIPGIKKYWMKRTQKVRLTPGMDPALRRELAPEIKTIDAYNADPNDPNGWLLPPAKAHAQYMHYIARRVEFEKLGVERGAASGVEYVMEQLDAIPEELQPQIDEAIMANLGKFGENMNSGWRLFNSVAAVWTVFTTLLFTTLSSVTDIAGIATRSKEFNNLGNFVKNMQTTLTTREFQELARAVGVVTGRAQSHMMIGQGELDYANQTSRNIMDAFFRYTGLEFYTRFVRTFAVGMGREFIVNTANKAEFGVREVRYLAELGLTREDVQAWQAGNMDFNTPEGEKVRFAIARFADEAVIRPDASQRPTWASNPYLQTVWQLKSYYYGFGKTVMGGIGREIKNRHSEDGNFNGAAGTALLLGVTIFPLAMFGLASREWAKYLFQLALPGIDEEPFRTSYMTGLEYPIEIVKRSGIFGPFALGLTTMEAFQYEGIAAPFTANIPMFDMVDDFFADGDVLRPIPVLNNIQ